MCKNVYPPQELQDVFVHTEIDYMTWALLFPGKITSFRSSCTDDCFFLFPGPPPSTISDHPAVQGVTSLPPHLPPQPYSGNMGASNLDSLM